MITRTCRCHHALLFCAMGLLLLTSCTSTKQGSHLEGNKIQSIDASDDQLKAVGETYVKNFIKGLEDRNRDLFAENFTVDMRDKLKKAVFENLCDKFDKDNGKLESIKFLCILDAPPFKRMVWKTKFTNNKKQLLTILLLGKLDDKYKIFGFYFF